MAVERLCLCFLSRTNSGINEVSFITTHQWNLFGEIKNFIGRGTGNCIPFVIWQFWSFVLPALKQHEKKYIYIIVPWSVLLFLGGVAFSFYMVLPVGLKFLLFAGGEAVDSTPFVTKSSYLNFILTFMVSFGLVFQLPIVLLLLIKLEYLSPKTLAKHRKWAFFLILVIAVLISPTPDLVTQFLMAGPMYLLYEASIWLGYLVLKSKKKKLAKEGEG